MLPMSGAALVRLRAALAPHWGALLALALFLVAGLAVLDDYGVTTDERWNQLNAAANINYVMGDADAIPSALPVEHNKFYGMAYEAPLLLAQRAFDLGDSRAAYLFRHLCTHLFFLAGGFFSYLLAFRLFGNRFLALFAMLLFLLHPRLYAHSFFSSIDTPFLVMFVVALFLAHRAFRRDSLAAFVLLGVGVGLLVNLRIIGIVLLASIPALRALDFAFASNWAERKRVLLTSGGFALASALTIYALQPYLWADPVWRTVEWWTTLSDHPHTPVELFRGTRYWSVEFPIEYLPVWFSITSPPFALALGFAGAAFVLVMAAKSIRRALRNGRSRFAALLAGCFAAPIPIVICWTRTSTMDGGTCTFCGRRSRCWRRSDFMGWRTRCDGAPHGAPQSTARRAQAWRRRALQWRSFIHINRSRSTSSRTG